MPPPPLQDVDVARQLVARLGIGSPGLVVVQGPAQCGKARAVGQAIESTGIKTIPFSPHQLLGNPDNLWSTLRAAWESAVLTDGHFKFHGHFEEGEDGPDTDGETEDSDDESSGEEDSSSSSSSGEGEGVTFGEVQRVSLEHALKRSRACAGCGGFEWREDGAVFYRTRCKFVMGEDGVVYVKAAASHVRPDPFLWTGGTGLREDRSRGAVMAGVKNWTSAGNSLVLFLRRADYLLQHITSGRAQIVTTFLEAISAYCTVLITTQRPLFTNVPRVEHISLRAYTPREAESIASSRSNITCPLALKFAGGQRGKVGTVWTRLRVASEAVKRVREVDIPESLIPEKVAEELQVADEAPQRGKEKLLFDLIRLALFICSRRSEKLQAVEEDTTTKRSKILAMKKIHREREAVYGSFRVFSVSLHRLKTQLNALVAVLPADQKAELDTVLSDDPAVRDSRITNQLVEMDRQNVVSLNTTGTSDSMALAGEWVINTTGVDRQQAQSIARRLQVPREDESSYKTVFGNS